MVTSPLTPVTLNEASVTSGSTAQVAENRKHASNDTKCSELGWMDVPFAVETSLGLFHTLLSEPTIPRHRTRLLSMADLITANARALLSRSMTSQSSL